MPYHQSDQSETVFEADGFTLREQVIRSYARHGEADANGSETAHKGSTAVHFETEFEAHSGRALTPESLPMQVQ